MGAYTVTELRDSLNELIELGYGEIPVYKNGDYVAQEEVDMVGIYGLKCVIMNHWMDEWIQTKEESLQMIGDRIKEIVENRNMSCLTCKLSYQKAEHGRYFCRHQEYLGYTGEILSPERLIDLPRYQCYEDDSYLSEFSKLKEYYMIMLRKIRQEADLGLGEALLENNSYENYNKLNNGE